MIKSLAVILVASVSLTSAQPYAVTRTFAGPDGSYDYVSIDDTTDRIFVGREFGVMALDVKTGRSSTLLARADVAAVLLIPHTRRMLSTNGSLNTATLFDRDTGAVAADIATGQEPDGAYYDPGTRLAFVMNGASGDLTVIDPVAARSVATIPVGGTPEGAVGDGKGRLFVNIEDTDRIAVVDIARRKVSGSFRLPGCKEPTGIAYDRVSDTLISACRNGVAKLVHAATGRDRGTLSIGKGADGSVFDPASRNGFVSCIDGTLTSYTLSARGTISSRKLLATRDGARTVAYDPARDRAFLPFATVERDAAGAYVRAKSGFGVLMVGRVPG